MSISLTPDASLIEPSPGTPDDDDQARLLGKAKAMAKLAHPNVVNVFEVGEHEGRVFLAMECVRARGAGRDSRSVGRRLR